MAESLMKTLKSAEYEAVFETAKPGWVTAQQPSLPQQELTP
jgi:hypothetical protein